MRVVKIEVPKHLRKRGKPKEWYWIEDVEEYRHQNDDGEWCRGARCGPYETWTEANDDRRGMQAIYDNPRYTGKRDGS